MSIELVDLSVATTAMARIFPALRPGSYSFFDAYRLLVSLESVAKVVARGSISSGMVPSFEVVESIAGLRASHWAETMFVIGDFSWPRGVFAGRCAAAVNEARESIELWCDQVAQSEVFAMDGALIFSDTGMVVVVTHEGLIERIDATRSVE